MARRLDLRTLLLMLAALLVGAAWAGYNLAAAAALRGDQQARALVWVYFAAPFALFLGWLVARRSELAVAAFCSFCLYFFAPFVAARVESLVISVEQAQATGHRLMFTTLIGLHLAAGLGLALWRALTPVPQPQPIGQLADS